MFGFFKNLFKSSSTKVDYKALMKDGAQIVDVRSPGEYKSGHVQGSVNIPLDALPNNLSRISKSKPVITCCASGMRSGSARSLLLSAGYTEVYNGGSWTRLQSQI
jgi:rhodanese-related sulfurtransferase